MKNPLIDETVFIQIDKLREQNRDLKKEIIKLKSLNRRAAEEIRMLDDMIIKSIEDNKVIEYPEEDKAYFAGFSSINLLNRLDGITNGGYVENYDDLHLEMKTLDGWYVAEHPDFYKNEHPPECKWHKDWHACDCGAFDDGGNTTERVEEQATRLEKIAEQKKINEVFDQITSCAIKAAKQVMEEHSKAFEKLAESEE